MTSRIYRTPEGDEIESIFFSDKNETVFVTLASGATDVLGVSAKTGDIEKIATCRVEDLNEKEISYG